MWDVFWIIVCACLIILAVIFLLVLCAVTFGIVVMVINTFTGKLENMSKRISNFIG